MQGIVIRFIGLILFYQAGVGTPQHAFIPQWHENQMDCQQHIMEHRPWIRVSTKNGGIVDDTKWPKFANCKPSKLQCVVYRIPDGSTLTIDPGFVPTTTANEQVPCLVPDFRSEHLVVDAKLRSDAVQVSAADYVLPPGFLSANQFRNDNIYTTLTLPAPPGAKLGNVIVTATSRDGKTAHVLVLKPGTNVDIVSAPPAHVVMDPNTIISDPDATDQTSSKAHFFFLHELLDAPTDAANCIPLPESAPDTCTKESRVHVRHVKIGATLGVGCGNGRISPIGSTP